MENVNVNVSTFLDAFRCFMSYADSSFTPNILASFSELKEKKLIKYSTETQYFNGNHDQRSTMVELALIEYPIKMYVVKTTHEDTTWLKDQIDIDVFIVKE